MVVGLNELLVTMGVWRRAAAAVAVGSMKCIDTSAA